MEAPVTCNGLQFCKNLLTNTLPYATTVVLGRNQKQRKTEMKTTKNKPTAGKVLIKGRWVRQGFVAKPSTDADRARILSK